MVITVHCPSCATSFPVDPRKIPEKGVKVRCSSCSAIFRVERPVEAAPPPPPPPPAAPAPTEPPPYRVDEAPAAEDTSPPPVAERAPWVETAPPPPVAEEALPVAEEAPPVDEEAPPVAEEAPPVVEKDLPVEAAPPPPVLGSAPPFEIPSAATPELFEEPGPQLEAPELEEPREEAGEGGATDVPAAATEPPSEAEIDSWLTPTPEFEIRPAPEAERAAEPEPAPEPEAYVGAADDWVVERDPDIDTSSLHIERLETIETGSDEVREEVTLSETPFDFEPTSPPMETPEPAAEAPVVDAVAESFTESPPFAEPVAPAEAEPPAPPEAQAPPAAAAVPPPAEVHREPTPKPTSPPPGVGAFTLGKRDPKDKARRLARVLVSDMIMYNPQRHERALAKGTLKEDFEDEIRKSWKEYVEQVGEQMARENDYWTEALNDVLAKGQQVF